MGETVLNTLHNGVDWVAEKTDAIPVIGTLTGWGKNITDYAADKKNGRSTSVLHLLHDGTDTLDHTFRHVPVVRKVTGFVKGSVDSLAGAKHLGDKWSGIMNSTGDFMKGAWSAITDFLFNNKAGLIGGLLLGGLSIGAVGGIGGALLGLGAFAASSFFLDGNKGLASNVVSKLTPETMNSGEAKQREAALETRKEVAQAAVTKETKSKGSVAVSTPKVPSPELGPQHIAHT